MRSLKEIMAGLPWARRCVIERRADELAQEAENAELRASLETAVGANAMWKRLYDELRAVIDSRDKAAGFEPLRSETAESKAVCTVAHDDCVLGVGEPNFCPYCEIERLINESEEMCKVRLMLYAERDYARQAARNADAKLAEAERDAERLKERLEEATDLLGFAEIRLLAFGQHRSANPDYVLAMDAIKLFLLTADSAKEGK